MNSPKISVIVPIYNAEKYLKKCLDSITKQTYKNLEIILVNDGSTDESINIIEEYVAKDSRIININKENGGIGSAYEVAFISMTGDYVSFVDSDDYIAIEMYEELVEIIKNNNPDIIQFGMNRFDDTGNVYKTELPDNIIIKENENILMKHFSKIKTPSLACRIFNIELFQGINIFQQSVGIDELTYIQLITKSKVYVATNKAYYYVYHRQESVSRSKYTLKKIQDGIFVHKYITDHIKMKNDTFAYYTYIKYIHYIRVVLLEIEEDDFKLEECNIYEMLFKEYRETYKLLKGRKELKVEKLSSRLSLRWIYLNPRSYYGVRSLIKKGLC